MNESGEEKGREEKKVMGGGMDESVKRQEKRGEGEGEKRRGRTWILRMGHTLGRCVYDNSLVYRY